MPSLNSFIKNCEHRGEHITTTESKECSESGKILDISYCNLYEINASSGKVRTTSPTAKEFGPIKNCMACPKVLEECMNQEQVAEQVVAGSGEYDYCVIIPTTEDRTTLVDCVESALGSSGRVVVVCDGEGTGQEQEVSDIAHDVYVVNKPVMEGYRNPLTAFFLGVEETKEPVIVFTHDDIRFLNPRQIDELADAAETKGRFATATEEMKTKIYAIKRNDFLTVGGFESALRYHPTLEAEDLFERLEAIGLEATEIEFDAEEMPNSAIKNFESKARYNKIQLKRTRQERAENGQG
jgi:molybdopterin-guanine dinucleotide biosynthesis protein A